MSVKYYSKVDHILDHRFRRLFRIVENNLGITLLAQAFQDSSVAQEYTSFCVQDCQEKRLYFHHLGFLNREFWKNQIYTGEVEANYF